MSGVCLEKNNRVLVNDAAKELGISPTNLRVMMLQQHLGVINNFDIGFVMPSRGGKKYSYYIYRDKLNALLGKK